MLIFQKKKDVVVHYDSEEGQQTFQFHTRETGVNKCLCYSSQEILYLDRNTDEYTLNLFGFDEHERNQN